MSEAPEVPEATEASGPPGTTVAYLRTITQARSATETGQWRAAAELWERAVAANPVNGNNWYGLAEAAFATGDYRRAVTAYEQALAIGVWERHFEPVLPAQLWYRVARCHAGLGDVAAARAALRTALEAGYRDRAGVWADERLAALRTDDWFVDQFAPPERELSRDEGWRADLHLLAHEAARRSYHFAARVDRDRFQAVVEQLDREIPHLSQPQILVGFKRLVGLLDDGHAFVLPKLDDTDLRRALPVQFYQFAEGVFITAAAPAQSGLLGARVLGIEGRPLEAALAALTPLIARDNAHWQTYRAPQLLRQTVLLTGVGLLADPAEATLEVRLADGTRSSVTLPADSLAPPSDFAPCPPSWRFLPYELPGEPPLYLRHPAAPYWFDLLPEQRLAYVQWNAMRDAGAEPVEQFWDRLLSTAQAEGCDRLVIDVRGNGGGNTFKTLPVLHQLIGHRLINQRGHLFLVVGRNTFSAAQNFATELVRHTHAIVVGEPTGSRPNFVGETVPFELPYSGLLANVSDLYWQSSWPLDHRSWLAPDLYAPPTFEAFAANRDPALAAIIASFGEHLPGW